LLLLMIGEGFSVLCCWCCCRLHFTTSSEHGLLLFAVDLKEDVHAASRVMTRPPTDSANATSTTTNTTGSRSSSSSSERHGAVPVTEGGLGFVYVVTDDETVMKLVVLSEEKKKH
jgi:hypothetical protein